MSGGRALLQVEYLTKKKSYSIVFQVNLPKKRTSPITIISLISYLVFFCSYLLSNEPLQWCGVVSTCIKCSSVLCIIVTSTIKFNTVFFFLAVIPAGNRESPCLSNHPDAKRTRLAGTFSNNCSCIECGSLLSGCDAALHERI